MEQDYKLCRRELSEGRLCNATIAKKNAMNWCPSCRERLPFWPTNEEHSVEDCDDVQCAPCAVIDPHMTEGGIKEVAHEAAIAEDAARYSAERGAVARRDRIAHFRAKGIVEQSREAARSIIERFHDAKAMTDPSILELF